MIQDVISASVGLVYVIPILLFIHTQNPIHLKAFAGSFITVLTECIKHDFIHKKSPRPAGALNCNLWCNDGNMSGQPGMPSGHSVNAAFFSGFYFQQTKNPTIRIVLITYAGLIMLSRYLKKCHTVGQITAGALIGLGFSWIVNRL